MNHRTRPTLTKLVGLLIAGTAVGLVTLAVPAAAGTAAPSRAAGAAAPAPAVYFQGTSKVVLTHVSQEVAWQLVNNSGQDICGTVWFKDAGGNVISSQQLPPYDGKVTARWLNVMGLWTITGNPNLLHVCGTATYVAAQDWRVDVRYGSRARLAATRKGGRVTLTADVQRWGEPAQIPGWTSENGAQVTFERWSNGAWHALATKQVRHGKAIYSLSRGSAAKYRAEVAATPDIWDSHSNRVSQ
jgi:hypothetical protein